MEQKTQKGSTSTIHKVLSVIGVILCIVFGFLLICNITIIIKGTLYPDRPPSVLSTTPLVVMSGSMSGEEPGHVEVGDLIFVGKADPAKLKVGDVIAFMESDDSTTVVTHRIIEIKTAEDGSISWQTKGDANNAPDENLVSEADLVGIYQFRIPKVGDFALFLQKPLGMVIFIGIPLLAFIIYDIVRRQKYATKENQKTVELEAEIARLKALTEEQSKSNVNEDTN
jgi:signal peptidase